MRGWGLRRENTEMYEVRIRLTYELHTRLVDGALERLSSRRFGPGVSGSIILQVFAAPDAHLR